MTYYQLSPRRSSAQSIANSSNVSAMRRYLSVNPASKSDSALTLSMWASALAISETVMPDSLASCRSLACLNWTIDTTTKTQQISWPYLLRWPSSKQIRQGSLNVRPPTCRSRSKAGVGRGGMKSWRSRAANSNRLSSRPPVPHAADSSIGSITDGSSFSGLLTRVEIGHIRIGVAGNGTINSRGSGSSLSQRA
jgi:hypothetical protein